VSTAEPKQTGARRGERLYNELLGKKFEMEAFRRNGLTNKKGPS
jgi:FlaA1/EpsC-like NDP-sugar epimerase